MNCFNFFTKRRLRSKTNDNTKLFTFDGQVKIAKCVDVYDGDTITVVFKHDNKYQKFKVRMLGYDSPELRTRDADEKEYAREAKKQLSEKLLGKIFKLECGKFDKYGRLLGTVVLNGVNINEWMIESNMGVRYDGGTKQKIKWKLGETNITNSDAWLK